MQERCHLLRLGEGGAIPSDCLRATDERHAKLCKHETRKSFDGILVTRHDDDVLARVIQVDQRLHDAACLAVREELSRHRVHAVKDRELTLRLREWLLDATDHGVARLVPQGKLDLSRWLYGHLVEQGSYVAEGRRGGVDALRVVSLVPSIADAALVLGPRLLVVLVQVRREVVRVGEPRV